MRGDGGRVEQVFAAWLSSQGWQVRRQVGYMDVVAERNGQRLVAEVKGRTGSPGLDVDTLFGQLLRRMAGGDDSTRYAVVVRAGRSLTAVERVHPDVRRALRLEVYTVTDEDEVTQH
jgi:predicted RecB family endonuclease